MSDLAKGVIGLLIWLLLTILSFNITKSCICSSLPFCRHEHIAVNPLDNPNEESIIPQTVRLPIDFRKSDDEPLMNEGFEALKKELLSQSTGTHLLEITGYYYEGERNSSTYANLGLARANALKKVFLKEIPENRFRIKTKLSPVKLNEQTTFLDGVAFNWIVETKRTTVEILADHTIIRFPFNSTTKEVDPNVDTYLEHLARRVKATKEKVNLTGHTDNVGNAEINIKLALRRAKMIRDILIEKGVNHNQINTYSKGENEPIAPNDTEVGKQKNRRVVVRLIEKK